MTKIPYEMTCEEKVRFWKEATWFWRKETEQMERMEKTEIAEKSYCRACKFPKMEDFRHPLNSKLKIGHCPWCGRNNSIIEERETDV